MNKNIFKNSEKGVSLVIAFFIMIIILAIIISITTLLYKEIKMIRNIGNSVVAFYAADSGIEKVMYYDRKVIPEGAERGLCSMFYSAENLNGCLPEPTDTTPDLDLGLYCNENGVVFLRLADSEDLDGCDADVCDNCIISFYTNRLDNTNTAKSYEVTATITPSEDFEDYSNLEIGSTGFYKSTNRKIELYLTKAGEGSAVNIIDGFVTPVSQEYGTNLLITATIQSLNTLSSVSANIKSIDEDIDVDEDVEMLENCTGDGIYECGIEWTGPVGAYYVTITAVDTDTNSDEMQLY
jgi:hypothetical protein